MPRPRGAARNGVSLRKKVRPDRQRAVADLVSLQPSAGDSKVIQSVPSARHPPKRCFYTNKLYSCSSDDCLHLRTKQTWTIIHLIAEVRNHGSRLGV